MKQENTRQSFRELNGEYRKYVLSKIAKNETPLDFSKWKEAAALPASPEPEKRELTVKIAGEEYQLNWEQTHVRFGGEWREIQDDQDEDKYFRAGGDIYYLDNAPEPAEAEMRGERMDELKWRESNPEAAKWYDAFKSGNQDYIKLMELSVKLKAEHTSMYAALKIMCDKIHNGWEWTAADISNWEKMAKDLITSINNQ